MDPLKNWEGNFLEFFPFARFVSGLGWLDSDTNKNFTTSPSIPTSIMSAFWVKANVKLHSNFVVKWGVLNLTQMGSFFQGLFLGPKGTIKRVRALNSTRKCKNEPVYCTPTVLAKFLLEYLKYQHVSAYAQCTCLQKKVLDSRILGP